MRTRCSCDVPAATCVEAGPVAGAHPVASAVRQEDTDADKRVCVCNEAPLVVNAGLPPPGAAQWDTPSFTVGPTDVNAVVAGAHPVASAKGEEDTDAEAPPVVDVGFPPPCPSNWDMPLGHAIFHGRSRRRRRRCRRWCSEEPVEEPANEAAE